MAEIVLRIPAIEKLVDYTASGVGAIAGPLLLPWRAYMQGKADRISAKAYADTLPIIAQAQADARQYLVAPDADVQGAAEITHENITQLLEFQGRKRLANYASVVESAAEELGEQEVADHEPDHDWTARFFDCVQDVSSEHMQKLWAKILSGEVESPGRTSLRTLETLRNMTKSDAELFEAVAGYVFEGEIVFHHKDYNQRHYVLNYNNLLHLEDCGLINVTPFLATDIDWEDRSEYVFSYHTGALVVVREDRSEEKLSIPAVLLTTAGKELLKTVSSVIQMEYLQDLSSFLHSKGCRLIYVEECETLPDGRIRFSSHTPIEPIADQVDGVPYD